MNCRVCLEPQNCDCLCGTCIAAKTVMEGNAILSRSTNKSETIEKFLESLSGRTTAITTNHCVPAPIGCGKPITDFRDSLSQKEYTISGLCQNCQDSIFGQSEE